MEIIIRDVENGLSVKEYLYKVLKLSTAAVKRVKYRSDGITVNGETVTVRKVLAAGDVLSLAMEDTSEDENEYTVPVDLPIGIAFEDSWLTVVDKPPSMPSHPSLGHKDDTVANALAFRYRNVPYVFRPVNRLDRDTSGLMLVAMGKISSGRLYKSMVSGQIKKSYIAVLEGVLSESGRIETYMCREGDSIVKRTVCTEDAEGAKIAITEYEVVENGENFTVVRAHPITGRTHQLRVHFASIGHPIFGDSMYGNACKFIDRHALHACALSFPHPENGELLNVEAPLPEDMRILLENLKK